MRKLLISTTALSVAMAPLGTMPGFAQSLLEDGSVIGADGSVLCMPVDGTECDLDAIMEGLAADTAAQAEAEAAAQAAVEAEAAAQAAVEAEAAAAEAAIAAEADGAGQAEAEAAATAEADAEAAAIAAAEAEDAAVAAAEAEAAAVAAAEVEAAAVAAAEAEAAAQAAAQAEADAAAIVAAETEAAAQAAAEAQAQAQAEADAGATAAAEAEAVAQAEADAAAIVAAEAEAASLAATEAAAVAAEEAQAASAEDAEAAAVAAAEAEAAAQAALLAAEEAAAQAATDAAALAEAEAAAEAVATEAPLVIEDVPLVEDIPVLEEIPVAEDTPVEGIFDAGTGEIIDPEVAAAARAAAEAELDISDTGVLEDPAAGLLVSEPETLAIVEPVDAPVVSEAEVESLSDLLTDDPTVIDPSALAAARTVAEAPEDGAEPQPIPLADPEELIGTLTQTITEDDVRTSDEEFAAAPVETAEGKKSGLSNLEKAGLIVLGALVVGAIIKSNREQREEETRVVSNTGDRVIVLRPDGTYQVLKDDDTIIRRPGSTVRTETFRDGSTRTIIEREDGTQVVTIRDASGRVLRRATYDDRGREIVLIDDLREEEVVVVSKLPRPLRQIVISSKDEDTILKRELAALEADKAGRKFSLRQIREIPEVRALAAVIDTENVSFASGSAAIAASEARDLADLGQVMQDLLEVNPGEVFLIEGHTDATGKTALNLALSDRRAESVALALTEYFDIPPENLIVQGYGETELLVDTQASEPENRRVEVRVITPLLRTAAN